MEHEPNIKSRIFKKLAALKSHGSLSSSAQSTSVESRWSPVNQRDLVKSESQEDARMSSACRRLVSSRSQLGESLESADQSIDDQDPEEASQTEARQRDRDGQPNHRAIEATDQRGLRSAHDGWSPARSQTQRKLRFPSVSRALLFFKRRKTTSNSQVRDSGPMDKSRGGSGESERSSVSSPRGSPTPRRGSNSNLQQAQVPQFIVPRMNALKLPLLCRIKSLEGELMREVFVHRYELGQYLIESLKVSLGLDDCKFFGLKMAKSFDDQEDLRNSWLDLNESVCKQIKSKSNSFNSSTTIKNNQSNCKPNSRSVDSLSSSISRASQFASFQTNGATSQRAALPNGTRSIDFYLRIKFYPPNLSRVQDSFLRNYLWLQLRRDLRLGKLTSSMANLSLLMAYVMQYELGDYRPELVDDVLPDMNILPNQDLIEEQAIGVWSKQLVGMKRHQAQMQFLRAAVILETYGFDYYPVRDHQRQRAYLLGFNYAGIKTIRNGRIVHHFSWHSLSKISYERRMIIFHIEPTENSKRKQILGFKCLTNEDCHNLYMRLLEQKYFFTVDLTYFDKSIRRPNALYEQDAQGQASTLLTARATTTSSCQSSSLANNPIDHSPPVQWQPISQMTTNMEPSQQSDGLVPRVNGCRDCEQMAAGSAEICDTIKSLDEQHQSADQRSRVEARGSIVRRQNHRLQRQLAMPQYKASPSPDELAHVGPASSLSGQTSIILNRLVDRINQLGHTVSVSSVGQSMATLIESITHNQGEESTLSWAFGINLDRQRTTAPRANSVARWWAPAVRFCLVILAMNFVLKCTDSLSSSLIKLMTNSKTDS